jgi:hypothetical protein
VRIFVATIGSQRHHDAQRSVFAELAAADSVGIHAFEDSPDSADALLFVDLHQHPDDPLLRSLRRHDLVAAYWDRLFVLDQRDDPLYTLPGIYVSANWHAARRLPLLGGPHPVLPNLQEHVQTQPDLLFSFQGSRTHPVRDMILRLRHPRAVLEDTTAVNLLMWQPGDVEARRRALQAYRATIARSKFVLCPRGHGASTFRLYETLAAGRVPVVIADTWLPPPRVDWNSCVITVPERHAEHIPQILTDAEPSWETKAAAGRAVWAEHFAKDQLWHHYAQSLADLTERRGGRSRWPWPLRPENVTRSARHWGRRLRQGALGLRREPAG